MTFEFRSRFYYITYELDAPIKLRYNNFKNKYSQQNHYTLDQFVELNDLINFNNINFEVIHSDTRSQ